MSTKRGSDCGRLTKITTALMVLTALSGVTATAQTPRGEVAGGYAYFHETDFSVPAGWFASGGASVNNWFGVVGTVTGHYKTETVGLASVDTRLHTFMGGPKLRYQTNRLTPFLTFLAGGARGNATARAAGVLATESLTKFAAHTGVGLDLNVTSRFAVRVGLNQLYIHNNDEWNQTSQFIAGVVGRW
jgi:hypothetical protein